MQGSVQGKEEKHIVNVAVNMDMFLKLAADMHILLILIWCWVLN